MSIKNNKTIWLFWNIVMMLVSLNSISQGLVKSSQILDKTKFGPAPTGTIKTIEVPEDGDMIDCVDIYKQPAFRDPLIKKDFQMIPTKAYNILFNRTKILESNVIQNWNLYGECPEGSVPIRRTWNDNRNIHQKITSKNDDDHEYAIARQNGSIYHGAAAILNVWNPRVQIRNEFSLTQLWVVADRNSPINTIECGWIVYMGRYRDTRTRLFTYWTSDGYNRTGCYDLSCAGFVQTNRQWVLGGSLLMSTYKGPQQELRISVFREPTGRWWIEIEGTKIGYFPSSKFPTLRDGADAVEIGGEIVNEKHGNKHTATEMGSGKFPYKLYKRASYIRNIKVINEHHQTVDASLVEHTTRAECYDLDFRPPETSWGTYFYYGGPGYSRQCFTP